MCNKFLVLLAESFESNLLLAERLKGVIETLGVDCAFDRLVDSLSESTRKIEDKVLLLLRHSGCLDAENVQHFFFCQFCHNGNC